MNFIRWSTEAERELERQRQEDDYYHDLEQDKRIEHMTEQEQKLGDIIRKDKTRTLSPVKPKQKKLKAAHFIQTDNRFAVWLTWDIYSKNYDISAELCNLMMQQCNRMEWSEIKISSSETWGMAQTSISMRR